MGIGPVNTGHSLLIPKKHFPLPAEMDGDRGRHVFKIAHRTAEAVHISGIKCEGINPFRADGEAAFQAVFHIHMHVLPRYKGDPFRKCMNPNTKPPREELDLAAQQKKPMTVCGRTSNLNT